MSLKVTRPTRPGPLQADDSHVERARSVVSDDSPEKPIKVLCPPKYHTAMNELKNMSADAVPVKYFMIEAMEDLFEKYKRGDGSFKINDVDELVRRLNALMK